MKKEIIQFGIMRSGSTLVYNILVDLFPEYSIIKTHKYPGKLKTIFKLPVVCTYRDPLAIICSSIKSYKQKPSFEVINQHIKRLDNNGFNDFIKLENSYKNKINLQYEKFFYDMDYIFDELQKFFQIKIKQDKRIELKNKFSIAKVKEKIRDMKSFEEYDSKTKYHGLHISDTDGAVDSYLQFFDEKDLNYLRINFKEFRNKYLYK